jgi:hypothetical protein
MSKERFLTVLVPIKDSDCVETVYATEAALNTAVPPTLDNITNIYKIADGTYRRVWINPSSGVVEYHEVSDREFPYIGNPLEIFDFTYDATRMGTAPSISAQGVMRYADSDGTTLDGLWSQQCHVVFDGKKLYLKQIPTSSKSNEDARYKYDMDFVDERVVLEMVYLYDVVSPFITERPITESSSFSFYGDINELAKRINASLIRSGLASLTRKQVYYNGYPKIVPYLTYEQWTMFNVDPERLYQDGIFEGQDEMMAFYNIYNNECHGDYNLYLMGYIYENTNGVYDLSGYQCKIGKDKYGNQSTSEEKLITFENNTIHEALQQFHDTFELEYYITSEKDSNGNFTGNTWIMVADCEHDFADWDESSQDFERDEDGIPISTNPFEYGDTEALISKEKTNTTDKIVTRITGVGSTENIPWYYPNPNPDGWLRPFFARKGVEQSDVTVSYPVDEGTTVEDATRYEKFLKNRIGIPIKKGVLSEIFFADNYEYIGNAQPRVGMPWPVLVQYLISSTGGMNSAAPSMTFYLSYPQRSGCSSFLAKLYSLFYKDAYGRYRGITEVGSYESWETYPNPTPFQTMFLNRDGGDILNVPTLAGGHSYLLEIQYNIPYASIPVVESYDYSGYHYNATTLQYPNVPEDYTDQQGVRHHYIANTAYIGENFYDYSGLIPYARWSTSDVPNGENLINHYITPTSSGYCIEDTDDGLVSPIPRRSGLVYFDIPTGTLYECKTNESNNPTSGMPTSVFSANPLMSASRWVSEFLDMKMRVYNNDGWYIEGKKIELSNYGLGWPQQNGMNLLTDIFDTIEFQRTKWVTPMSHLMPEVFIKTDGERRFYNAHDYYPLQEGTADAAIGEEQVGAYVRNPIYKEEETDPDDKHYDFESEYRQQMPHEHIENFDDVKPTIKGQTNIVDGVSFRIDVVEMFDYDLTDNNEIWDNNEGDTIQGDYKHPYFFAKLRPLGFNIFDLATTNDMVLSMTTGNCGACNFKIGVDERTGKNPVQIWEYDVYDSDDENTAQLVYEAGSLRRYVDLDGLYYETQDGFVPVSSNMLIEGGGSSSSSDLFDRYTYSEDDVKNGLVGGVKQEGKKHFEGDVVTNGRFIENQQDTSDNYVWVALMKDTETYGVIMPSAIPNYKDQTLNQYIEPKGIEFTDRRNGETAVLTEEEADKFVLTNIRLPQIYLRRAERKLSMELVKYMYEHNWQRFNFSIKFSRIFIADNQNIDDTLNENSVLYVSFNGVVYRQYAKHYTYRMSHEAPLPETNVDMNEELSVSRTMTQQWDRKLSNSGRNVSYNVSNTANTTRDLAQKHYVGKYDDLVNPSSTSQGNTTNIYNDELEWGEF